MGGDGGFLRGHVAAGQVRVAGLAGMNPIDCCSLGITADYGGYIVL